nr:hypothetical protein, containing PKD domain [uncultured archaeon]
MKERAIPIGAIFIAMFFIGLLFIPLGMCNDNTIEEWIQPDLSNAEVITAPTNKGNGNTMDEWMQDHTIKVTSTITYKYEEEYLLVKEVYTGEELKERFGIEQLTKELKIPVEGMIIPIQKGKETVFVTEKLKTIIHWTDPPPWWKDYDYPQWTWFGFPIFDPIPTYYERGLPINLAWEETTKDEVKAEILEEEGWVDDPLEWHEYVYDPVYDGWIRDDGIADDKYGPKGRYHTVLWQMSNGDVVANAHHDRHVPHVADQLEEAEELIAGYFPEPEWRVCHDNYFLNNVVADPWSDGKCTQIFYGTGLSLDLIFVIDTTGSMGDDIANVKASASTIVNEIEAIIPDYQVAVVDYRDFPVDPYGGDGDYPFNDVLPFSTDKAAIISAIQGLTLGWGGDWEESVYSALMHSIDAGSLGGWRGEDQALKAIILMGDAPPHDPEPFTGYILTSVAIAAELADPVHIYTIQIGGPVGKFAELASQTGGEVFTAENAEEVVDAILEAIEEITKRPIANAGGPYNGYIGVPITFDGTGSYDPDGTIESYEWDLDDDGEFDDATGSTPAYTWNSEYTGNISLKVTDNDGKEDIDRSTVIVTEFIGDIVTLTKSGSPSTVAPGGTLSYTIKYSNAGTIALTNVSITENYPTGMTFISADPAPDAGTNNKWTLGTLPAGASGQIIIKLKVPEARDLSFTESGSVSGEGFVMVSKDLSTEQKPYSLKNVVTLSCAELAPVSASAFTTVSGLPGTSLELTEHGSGLYTSDEILNLQTKNKSIMLQKSTEAEYQPTSFIFSDGFAVNFATKWTQDICARNIIMGDAMHKKIKDASYIKDETIAEVGKYRTSMDFESSFYGAAHIGTVSKSAKTSEDYIGAFEITWAEREECRYLFNWSRVPGNDSEKLIQFLVDVLDLGWAENATITKSVDEMSINITDDGNTATITIDENKETATVKVGDEIIYVLDVRIEDDTLNIYDCKLEKMEESVSGIGYVMLDKDLASGQMLVREHGSGLYSSDMVFESGRLDKVTEAEYQPTSFNFSDGFAITFPSLWFQGICAKNLREGTAIHKKISEASSMEDDTTATKSSMEFESSFNGSMHIGTRTEGTMISEDYIGVFNITELIKIGKAVNRSTATPTPDWLPCPFPKPGVSTPPPDLECPSGP